MNFLTIAARDIRSTFVTPLAYIVIAGFTLLSAFFFFTLLQQYNGFVHQAMTLPNLHPNLNEWVVYPYYQTLEIVLIFLIPVLTMRSIAEEKRMGSFELLATSPLTIADIVWGKAIGIAVVLIAMLSCSFVFPLVLVQFADPEVPPILIGFCGLLLFAFAFASIGLAISASTKSQTIAGVVSFVVLLIFYVIDAPASHFDGLVAQVLSYLSPSQHAEFLLKGLLQGVDVVFFLSVAAAGIFLSIRILEAQKLN